MGVIVAVVVILAAALGLYWWAHLRCCPLCGAWREVTRDPQHGKCLRCPRCGTFTWEGI